MESSFTRKLLFLSGLILATVCTGTAGYMLIEGWSLFDSIYMTVITLATIGYGETHPLTDGGRLFTISLIVFGTGVLGYGISSLTLMLFQGDLPLLLKRRKMEKRIARLDQHIIICGLSRTGLYTLEELSSAGHDVVVIEKNEALAQQLDSRDVPYIVGDATADEHLVAAGVAKARALVTCLTSDAENAFVVVTAKNLNPSIKAVSKAETETSRRKLLTVGADRVVIPSHLGGVNMANMVARPETLHLFEQLQQRFPKAFHARLFSVGPESDGRRLGEFEPTQPQNVMVIALEHPGGEVEFNPSPETTLKSGSSVMAIINYHHPA